MIVDLALTKGLKTFETDTYMSYTCKSSRTFICRYLGNGTSTRLSAFCSPPDLKIFDLCNCHSDFLQHRGFERYDSCSVAREAFLGRDGSIVCV